MDTKNLLILKLNEAAPGALLETRRFGRSGVTSIWVEALSIQKVAFILKNDLELKLDWLENLSVVEIENVLIVSYFLRSTSWAHEFIIRASLVPTATDTQVSLPSIRSVWPMGEPMENEAAEMFGICFENTQFEKIPIPIGLLPRNWVGFPLRKGYIFQKEFLGIAHSQAIKRSSPKKS